MSVGLILIVVFLVLIVSVVLNSLRVIKEYERLVVFRWGKFESARGPGLIFLVPAMERGTKQDLRESFLEVPSQTCITKDNAPISIDFLIYWKVVSAQDSVLNVANFSGAAQGMATTTLRAVIGDISLDDVLAKREQINQVLRVKLDEVTGRWGVKVTSVEIREIVPPRDIQDAMNRQMAAERNRRATVTEAEGKRQATITVAEGDKQAAILKAEGDRQAQILRAEGERQAEILRAEGFSIALDRIFSVAKGVDAKTMTLQYFETLKTMGTSPATKYIFPLEFTRILQPFVNLADSAQEGGQGAGPGAPPAS